MEKGGTLKALFWSPPWTGGKWEVKNQVTLPLDAPRSRCEKGVFSLAALDLTCVAFQAHESFPRPSPRPLNSQNLPFFWGSVCIHFFFFIRHLQS